MWGRPRGSSLPPSELLESRCAAQEWEPDPHGEAGRQHPALYAFLPDRRTLNSTHGGPVACLSPLLLCWEAVALTQDGTVLSMGSTHTHTGPFPLFSAGAVTLGKGHNFFGVLSEGLRGTLLSGHVCPASGKRTWPSSQLQLFQEDEDGEKNSSG